MHIYFYTMNRFVSSGWHDSVVIQSARNIFWRMVSRKRRSLISIKRCFRVPARIGIPV